MKLRALGLVSLVGGTLVTQEPGTEATDPHALLAESRAACLAVESVRYRGRFEEFGERHAAGVTTAEVVLARGALGVRFRVRGERWFRDLTSPWTLDASFDGAVFRRRDPVGRTVVERGFEELEPGAEAWARAAGDLGAGGSGVVLWEFVKDDPFGRQLRAEDLEYEGRSNVLGVPCDVVVIPGDEPHESTRVFLGVDDHLPRKVERIFVMLTGRISGSLLTLSDVRVGEEPTDDVFALDVPSDHELEVLVPREVPDTLVAVGSLAPDFTLRDPDGVAHALEDLRGRAVVLDFWGTWCGPCVRKLPELQSLHARNRERAVTVIGISCFEAPNARPAEVMERFGCEFDLLLDGDEVSAAFGVGVFPSTVVVAPDGTVEFRSHGGSTLEDLQAAVDAALAKDAR